MRVHEASNLSNRQSLFVKNELSMLWSGWDRALESIDSVKLLVKHTTNWFDQLNAVPIRYMTDPKGKINPLI